MSEPSETDPLSDAFGTSTASPSRRRFLTFAAGGAATVAGGVYFTRDREAGAADASAAAGDSAAGTTVAPEPLRALGDATGRTLVVIELQGGNDGLATLVPRDSGVLYDRRPVVHIPDEELVGSDPNFGWHPNLAPILAFNTAALAGVGTLTNPDGSHFEMERRWWTGKSSGTELPATGFLGRLCDQLDEGQLVTGVSLGSGATPSLLADKAVTIGLADPNAGWFLKNEDPWFTSMRTGLKDLSNNASSALFPQVGKARQGLSDTLAFADSLQEIDTEFVDEHYPNTGLATQLGMAAQMIDQEIGVRVIHVSHGGFDTHSGQRGDHDYLMLQLGDAVGAFLDDIGQRGRADSTLVCTTSEFGRRVSQNDGGTDHGAAGMAMLMGPVHAGVHGEHPSLTDLDDDNLKANVDFEQYYATIAEDWFGIPSSEVLDSAAAPVAGLINV